MYKIRLSSLYSFQAGTSDLASLNADARSLLIFRNAGLCLKVSRVRLLPLQSSGSLQRICQLPVPATLAFWIFQRDKGFPVLCHQGRLSFDLDVLQIYTFLVKNQKTLIEVAIFDLDNSIHRHSMTKSIQNWAGNVQFKPENYLLPEHPDEIATYIRRAAETGKKIRTVGSAHSFSPLIETQDWLLSLDRYQGLSAVSKASRTATAKSGTKLYTLGELLFREGLAMENLGDIDRQSLAGALTTGTHGSGTGFGILATQVEELSLIDGLGNPHTCSRTQAPELFRAALVSMGLLGVITELKLRLEPAYRLHYVHRKGSLDETLENLENFKNNNRNFEFYWFPHTKSVQLKLVNRTDDSPRHNGTLRWINDVLIENAAFGALSCYARRFPSQAMGISRLCGNLISDGERVDWSHRVFATTRLVPFVEMEYNIPTENFVGAFRDMETAINKHRFAVHFPVECRWAKADDLLLSPANGRDSAYIAVHMYKGMPWKPYFETLEAIFKAHGGRPHWGKMNTCTTENFQKMYPDWLQFLAIREKMDPNRIFMNSYFGQLIG